MNCVIILFFSGQATRSRKKRDGGKKTPKEVIFLCVKTITFKNFCYLKYHWGTDAVIIIASITIIFCII